MVLYSLIRLKIHQTNMYEKFCNQSKIRVLKSEGDVSILTRERKRTQREKK